MMRILIASHGEFAKGIKSSLEIIMGPKENVEFINAYTTEESLEDSIKNVMDKIDESLITQLDLWAAVERLARKETSEYAKAQ